MAAMEATPAAWSEARLHAWLARRPRARSGPLTGSVGHDAAVLGRLAGRAVVCTDHTIEGVHVEPGTSARLVGRKAAARALSDLAATAARPVALVLALAAPRGTSERRLRALIEAVDGEAARHGAALVGGDLSTTSGPLALCVAALGVLNGRKRPPGRDRARVGDLVLLGGPVGGSALGRHLTIEPRFALARFLFERGARVLMDVSDGLARDLARIAERSGVRIDLERVPIHRDARALARRNGTSALEHALSDGEDHELLATLAPRAWARIRADAARRFPALAVVGRVRRGSGLWIPRRKETRPARARRSRAPETVELEPWDGRGGWLHGG